MKTLKRVFCHFKSEGPSTDIWIERHTTTSRCILILAQQEQRRASVLNGHTSRHSHAFSNWNQIENQESTPKTWRACKKEMHLKDTFFTIGTHVTVSIRRLCICIWKERNKTRKRWLKIARVYHIIKFAFDFDLGSPILTRIPWSWHRSFGSDLEPLVWP